MAARWPGSASAHERDTEESRMTKTDGTDRRSHALYLTPDGNALLDRADALVQEHEKRLVKKIGAAGHKQLLQILAVFGKRQ
jgi:DNA-binding MarR family transcriptional regulator